MTSKILLLLCNLRLLSIFNVRHVLWRDYFMALWFVENNYFQIQFLFYSLDIRVLLIFMIGRNYLIIFIFAKMNFSVYIMVYGMLDTMLAVRGRHNLLFRMQTCTLEPPVVYIFLLDLGNNPDKITANRRIHVSFAWRHQHGGFLE